MKTPIDIHPSEISGIMNDYCCSSCWGNVTVYADGDGYMVSCQTPDCPTPGLVSAAYVERRLAESNSDAIYAKMVLKDAIPWLQGNKRTEAEILRKLGY
jgi:hypothetical protein